MERNLANGSRRDDVDTEKRKSRSRSRGDRAAADKIAQALNECTRLTIYIFENGYVSKPIACTLDYGDLHRWTAAKKKIALTIHPAKYSERNTSIDLYDLEGRLIEDPFLSISDGQAYVAVQEHLNFCPLNYPLPKEFSKRLTLQTDRTLKAGEAHIPYEHLHKKIGDCRSNLKILKSPSDSQENILKKITGFCIEPRNQKQFIYRVEESHCDPDCRGINVGPSSQTFCIPVNAKSITCKGQPDISCRCHYLPETPKGDPVQAVHPPAMGQPASGHTLGEADVQQLIERQSSAERQLQTERQEQIEKRLHVEKEQQQQRVDIVLCPRATLMALEKLENLSQELKRIEGEMKQTIIMLSPCNASCPGMAYGTAKVGESYRISERSRSAERPCGVTNKCLEVRPSSRKTSPRRSECIYGTDETTPNSPINPHVAPDQSCKDEDYYKNRCICKGTKKGTHCSELKNKSHCKKKKKKNCLNCSSCCGSACCKKNDDDDNVPYQRANSKEDRDKPPERTPMRESRGGTQSQRTNCRCIAKKKKCCNPNCCGTSRCAEDDDNVPYQRV